ncbi:hypothetical protein ACWDSJ_19345 [Nocardia sp. NPDC003482]
MAAGSGTPMWVRALRVVSLLLGIVALAREELRSLTATLRTAVRRPLHRLRHPRGGPLPGHP